MDNIFKICIFFSILVPFSLPFSCAWTGYTHDWICQKANLSEIDCARADTPALQSKYPDASFKNHHCSDNSSDCSARKIADRYMIYSDSDARDISAHLYADSLVPVHWYSTDYDTCHKIFEDKVEEKLRNSQDIKYKLLAKEYDLSEWNISMECIAKFGKENRTVELYASDKYMDSVAAYVAERMGADADLKSQNFNSIDLTPILIAVLVIVIVLLISLFYIGLKNKNEEIQDSSGKKSK